ncbi:Nif3-like dinuclear metal center hexameric protein [Paludisphaera rhizosphaerae]|uniref:Nif3-like dinuclear metal center hexameric protein n=1 Tax=Paludisphaera rhizosphaerae TaxID=2711216 RepID=UPI0013EA8C8C|nr:Nif3-like dinuclear metal center hexameric protein [Paludisphaera rhizosphaerae]
MKTVAEVVRWLEGFAPSRLAESWDNVGLLWGDPTAAVERVMTCLTVTAESAAEAVREGAGLIVSHHPILFRETKKIRADLPATAPLWALARAGVAVASPHTAFDSASDGINVGLCRRLGLVDVSPIRSESPRPAFKVVVFTPEADREAVLAGAFEVGAGGVGDYSECSFMIPGRGTFFGGESTDPAVGEKGRRETVEELRIEFVCPGDRLDSVLTAIRARHSYEEPAIDVYPVESPSGPLGAGRIGRLEEPRPLGEFARSASRALGGTMFQVAGDLDATVERVAVSCGAGDDFLGDASKLGAQVLFTGEARFHRVLEAKALGMGLIVAGHYATERPGVEDLADRIARAFPELTVWPSRDEVDPLAVVVG